MFEFEVIAPYQIKEELGQLPFGWWVCGGWAIDLYTGKKIREHTDIDIAILRRDHKELVNALPNLEFRIAKDGVLDEWNGAELATDIHTLWARKKGADKWHCEFLLNEASDTEWIFRKDPRIKCLLSEMGLRTADGIPYLRPAITLLYKCNSALDKDEADLLAALAVMPEMEKETLRKWLLTFKPDSKWLKHWEQS